MSSNLKNFINVTRLNKPIGYLLLFWPCACGLSLANYFTQDLSAFFLLSFFIFLRFGTYEKCGMYSE